MLKILLILLISTFPRTLWAADPLIGHGRPILRNQVFLLINRDKRDINTYWEIEEV
jgi:hypothetical protein